MKKIVLAVILLFNYVNFVMAETDVVNIPAKSIVSGKKVVTTANTPVVLASDTAVVSVTLTWSNDSASPWVWVGSSSMTANNGITLTSGSVATLKVDNLADIYVNSPIARGSVGYIAEVR